MSGFSVRQRQKTQISDHATRFGKEEGTAQLSPEDFLHAGKLNQFS
jgi:hypothetical protein